MRCLTGGDVTVMINPGYRREGEIEGARARARTLRPPVITSTHTPTRVPISFADTHVQRRRYVTLRVVTCHNSRTCRIRKSRSTTDATSHQYSRDALVSGDRFVVLEQRDSGGSSNNSSSSSSNSSSSSGDSFRSCVSGARGSRDKQRGGLSAHESRSVSVFALVHVWPLSSPTSAASDTRQPRTTFVLPDVTGAHTLAPC